MISLLTAIVASTFLSFSPPSVNPKGDIQEASATCTCPCCKGKVCTCGMNRHAAVPEKRNAPPAEHSKKNVDCHCSGGLPVSPAHSDAVVSSGTSSAKDLRVAQSLKRDVETFPAQSSSIREASDVFDPSPPGSFRSIPLRI